MKRVRFHEAARDELVRETLYYRSIHAGLAERFASAIEQAARLAAEFPAMGSPYKYGTRRCFAKTFPFALVYVERRDEVYVIAVAHDRRKPGFWRARIGEG